MKNVVWDTSWLICCIVSEDLNRTRLEQNLLSIHYLRIFITALPLAPAKRRTFTTIGYTTTRAVYPSCATLYLGRLVQWIHMDESMWCRWMHSAATYSWMEQQITHARDIMRSEVKRPGFLIAVGYLFEVNCNIVKHTIEWFLTPNFCMWSFILLFCQFQWYQNPILILKLQKYYKFLILS